MTNYSHKLVFAAACVAIFLFGVTLISLGTIMPFLGSGPGFGDVSKGILATVLPFGILAGSLIFGPVADRYGYRYLLPVSAVLLSAGFILIAAATSFDVYIVCFFLLGTGGGILNGCANSLVSGLSEDEGKSKAANLSLMGVFYGIGALGMPFILGVLIRDFRFNDVVAGIGWVMILPIFFFVFIRYPKSGSGDKISFTSWMQLLGTPLMFLVGMIGFFQSGLESFVNNWLTSYLSGPLRVEKEDALFTLTLFVVIFTLARLALGILFRKFRPSLVLNSSMILVISGVIILLIARERIYSYPAVIILGMGLASTFPVITGHTGDLFKTQPGTAISILFTMSLLGNMGINFATGWITARSGMTWYPVLFLAFVVMTLVTIRLFYRKMKSTSNI